MCPLCSQPPSPISKIENVLSSILNIDEQKATQTIDDSMQTCEM